MNNINNKEVIMRVLKLKEFLVECDVCRAELAVTSEDVCTSASGVISYVKCPICKNTIILNHYQ